MPLRLPIRIVFVHERVVLARPRVGVAAAELNPLVQQGYILFSSLFSETAGPIRTLVFPFTRKVLNQL